MNDRDMEGMHQMFEGIFLAVAALAVPLPAEERLRLVAHLESTANDGVCPPMTKYALSRIAVRMKEYAI